jgi:peptidylprolyl isomerase
MSDTEPVKEEISPEITGEKISDVARAKAAEPEESTAGAVPDDASKKKRTNLVIMTGVAVIVLLVAVGAYLLLSGPVATTGDTVTVFYNESFDNGTVYLSNMNSTSPLVFTIGNSSVITGVQNAVAGMRVGDTKTVDISSADAYGQYDPGLIQTLNRTGPIANTTFIPGQYYTVYYKPINAYSTVKIINVTEKTITWDANNPLAGYNLTFTIKLANITKP